MAKHENRIQEIPRRWGVADVIVQGWAALPVVRRERVLAELPETARAVCGSDEQLASDLTAALDALEQMATVGSLDLVAHATNDIRALLVVLDETSKGG